MKLSIIIPNHNSKTLPETVESIYSSKEINKYDYEIILVDDGSTDGIYHEVEKQFPLVKIFRFGRSKGAAAARNKGIEESSGKFLLFIDSDMWSNKSTIKTLVKGVGKYGLCFPKIIYEDGQLMYPVLDIEKQYPHISGCFLVRKSSLEKLDEHFDEFYGTYLEDYDFFMRCSLAGLKAKYVDDARITHKNKEKRDHSRRYYLEVRNLMYGNKKLGRLAEKSGLYNPFTKKAILKALFYGLVNFAWFNWQEYYRETRKIKNSNKIFLENRFSFLKHFSDAVIDIRKNKILIKEKRESVRKFYNSAK